MSQLLMLLIKDNDIYFIGDDKMKRVSSALELIHNTPLIELKKLKKELNLFGNIYAKLESFNLTGSVKDRIVSCILENMSLKKGDTIIEATSGNTGISLSAIGALKGLRVIIIMPENMSKERQKIIKAYGGQVIITPKHLGMDGAVNKAKELLNSIPNSFSLNQFENHYNVLAHFNNTGPEIYSQLDGKIDCFVAGIGTGGTISGVSKYLKEKNKNILVYGVEPLSSPLLTKGYAGSHKIQGIGANFVPKTLNLDVIDKIIDISDENAKKYVKLLAKLEGLLVGYSSGASLCAAVELAKNPQNKDKNIVAILPDNGSKYLSTDLFD